MPQYDQTPEGTGCASGHLDLPTDFLTSPPREPIQVRRINWSQTQLGEFRGRYAVVLDGVLTPEECRTLLDLAEQAARRTPGKGLGEEAEAKMKERSGDDVWQPAMVSVGDGWEVLDPQYRNSDRLIWDHQEAADRLWDRIRTAGDVGHDLATAAATAREQTAGQEWQFHRLNGRMRFLRYGKGQFFRPHNDGPYSEEKNGHKFKTHYTVHLYLNDSVQEVGENAGTDLRGGATSFLSSDEKRKVDVDPRAGRVLIFQHSRLYHSGDDVLAGLKYTMRSDILYELVNKSDTEPRKSLD